VGVLPDQQGKGLGKLATAAGIDHLISMGATPVEITVDSDNAPAIHVYESVGFRLDHRSVWYERALG
jgi:mycothiol synthase